MRSILSIRDLVFAASMTVQLSGPCLAESTINTVETVRSDMRTGPDALPNGNEKKDYARFPRIHFGNRLPAGWNAGRVTGMIYMASGGHRGPVDNVRIEVRKLRLWVKYASKGTWMQVSTSDKLMGANFPESFSPHIKPIPITMKPEPGGGISVVPAPGYNFHFGGPRVELASDIVGVMATWQARLVLDDPRGPDNRSNARFVGSASADYWRSLTAQALTDLSNNGDVGIGRFKLINSDWQAYNMTTIPLDIVDVPHSLD